MAEKFIDGNNLKRALDYVADGTYGNLAKQDGSYDQLRAGEADLADNLTPYNAESGADQNEPFLFQATGTANGTQSDFATGSIALLNEKRGNTIVVNQLVNILTSDYWQTRLGTATFNDGVATCTCTESDSGFGLIQNSYYPSISGHKYLGVATIKPHQSNSFMFSQSGNTSASFSTTTLSANVWTTVFGVFTSTESTNEATVYIITNEQSQVDDVIEYKDVYLIDLTKWFGGNENIPSYLLSHPENWYRYYQGSLAHNEGTLVNANSRYIKAIGREQFDKSQGIDNYLLGITGETYSASGFGCSDYIEVIPNNTYHAYKIIGGGQSEVNICFFDKDKKFITYGAYTANLEYTGTFYVPSDCIYIRINYALSNKDDVTISIYYENESGYDQYYPYEVLTNTDTGTETLLSAGNVKDYKAPDGVVHRLVGVLSEPNWSYSSANSRWYCNDVISTIEKPANDNVKTQLTCLYESVSPSNFNSNGQITVATSGQIRCKNGSDTTPPSGSIYYKLATPTTEQGTPFSRNLNIDDFGSQDYSGTSGVPQGNLIFYPVDYKAFVDTLYNYTEGTPSELVKQDDLSAEETARETQDAVILNTCGNVLRQVLSVAKSVNFLDTDYIDLTNRNTTYITDAGFEYVLFIIYVPSILTDDYTTFKYISTKYIPTTQSNAWLMDDKQFLIATDEAVIFVRDDSFNGDVDSFKAGLKGVLVAYKKAE